MISRGTAVMPDPYVESWLGSAEGTHIVARSMDMEDGYWAHVGIGCSATHRIAADRAEGSNEVGDLVHGMISEHATHGKAAEVDTVAIYLMLGHHLVNNSLDKVDVAVARGVP